jgi:SNF2 family DNA or RNA helicase
MEESDSEKTRYEKWHDLFPRREHQVFLSTLQLGSESINLSSAQRVVFLDQSWSPKDNSQGVARLYRPGQEGQVDVIHIHALHTTDKYVSDRNEMKQGWFRQIFHDEETE